MTRSRYEEILIGPKNQGKSKVNPNHNMFKAVVLARTNCRAADAPLGVDDYGKL
ncbi:hypothetical protein [Stieleria bergensis]|uniref:hypothetical protein n=1 Tax=Stieleria bergensis TaxID=2528025 RepID=UPI003AF351B9